MIDTDTLHLRVLKLERSNRRLQRLLLFAMAFGVSLVGVFLFGAGPAKEEVRSVVTNKLIIRGPEGSDRITLGLNSDNEPVLRMSDKHGVGRVDVGINGHDDVDVVLSAANGTSLVALHGSKDMSSLSFNDSLARSWLSLETHYGEGPTCLNLLKPSKKGDSAIATASMLSLPDGESRISVANEGGADASVGLDKVGQPSLQLGDGVGTRHLWAEIVGGKAKITMTRKDGVVTYEQP